ncbi:N-acetyltransferase [Streptomyces dangxiongensis]|uniref:N-acetyltransferase n=1 Tax=Streptomyces dangxiongensis TaxID=1442032 RepID=A0A3G2JNC4_9ACTN|nr:GNAT family N-acetyltransferase [Streptomyces dangxiongensis]AYN43854.1 N-acetyltransferase [Streptomyces dangxiongensis]
MSSVRRARPEDAAEVLRLRQRMIDSLWGAGSSGPAGPADRHAESLPRLRERLGEEDGDFAAFVVEGAGRPGRPAAPVAGTVEYRIGWAGNPRERVGQVFSVVTDPDARRRGHARACMTELLAWFRARGAGHVPLNASPEAYAA